MLISDSYRKLNTELHETNEHYGTTAPRYVEEVKGLMGAMGTEDVLDYGCGKGLLQRGIITKLVQYDPCIPGKDTPPEPADLVCSIDVLEHIEPDCLDEVLDDIYRLAKKCVFLTVAMRPAKKTLADGRNAHLIVRPIEWWIPHLTHRWTMIAITGSAMEFVFVGEKKPDVMEMVA